MREEAALEEGTSRSSKCILGGGEGEQGWSAVEGVGGRSPSSCWREVQVNVEEEEEEEGEGEDGGEGDPVEALDEEEGEKNPESHDTLEEEEEEEEEEDEEEEGGDDEGQVEDGEMEVFVKSLVKRLSLEQTRGKGVQGAGQGAGAGQGTGTGSSCSESVSVLWSE